MSRGTASWPVQPAHPRSGGDRWLVWLVVGLATALVLALGVTNAAASHRGADESAATLMLELVNDARAEQDLPALQPADDMTAVAESWSAAMAKQEALEHNPEYTGQICCWTTISENVAYSEAHRFWRPGDPIDRITGELHERLLASPGHRMNLLDPAVDQIGIGVHVGDDGSVWITQNFRRYVPE